MKLAAKFARQETEAARLARVARRRVADDRAEAIRRMLDVPAETPPARKPPAAAPGRTLLCADCGRAFALPMHLGRHRKRAHDRPDAVA